MNLYEQENSRYDKIAERYDQTGSAIAKRFSYGPTLLHLTGDLSGNSVLDLACGSGFSTRLLLKCRPKRISGIDVSKKMIALANNHERNSPLGIDYLVGKVEEFNFNFLKPIDTITALFLLHYADSKNNLFRICSSIYNALPEGGRFITITSNPDFPQMIDKQYEVTSYLKKPINDGSIRLVKYWQNNRKLCSFLTYYWKQDTLMQTLEQSGFKSISFHQPIVSPEGLEIFGKQFWEPYFNRPHIIGITCNK